MNSHEQDKTFFESSLQQLEAYLLSKELYWPGSVRTTDFTQVTLGAMLLVRERLKGWRRPGLTELTMQMDAVRLKWRAAWDEKARREVRARGELWKNYLEEARRHPGDMARQYPYEVRLRAILTLLLDDIRETPADWLVSLDAELRRVLKGDAFVWDPSLAWNFPQESFWFLYGTLTQEK
ncbi:MAG: hypothetical protein C4583_18805 [Anaerolineaceae bacterium]|nr:MAG: hypothetical protein C4583_18805 [Anaerolineaceae bacterium]